LLLAWIILAILSSCTTHRKIIKQPIREQGADFLFQKLKEKELKFEWFQARFSAEYRNKNQEHAFSGQIRIRKDSIIWISISPVAGIEAMRLMISQDSVVYLNRLNNTYFKGDYRLLNDFLSANIDFDIIQSYLTGNDLSYYENGKFKADINQDMYRLTAAGRSKQKKYLRKSDDALKLFIQNIWLDPETYKIVRADVKEIGRENIKLEALYSSFETIESQLFPRDMIYQISAENHIFTRVSFSRITIDEPLLFPFRIPDSFTRLK
jgi:outer membrane lipoprotein-sorting protein